MGTIGGALSVVMSASCRRGGQECLGAMQSVLKILDHHLQLVVLIRGAALQHVRPKPATVGPVE